MFMKIALLGVLLFGSVSFASSPRIAMGLGETSVSSSKAEPVCCMKNAYCCLDKRPCCRR